jgi:superfamily II DNA or RNA helicase
MSESETFLRDHLKSHYRSGRASLAEEFFAPCLQTCTTYRRAAGYFSSSALITWTAALPRLASSEEVSIKIIASPELSRADIDVLKSLADPAQRQLYEDIIVDKILDDICQWAEAPGNNQTRARIFAWLLANRRLDIRFAFPAHVEAPGIFHEKIGVFDFPSGDRVAFTGSANETLSGHARNYESIDVYRSWIPHEVDRVETKVEQFEEAWKNDAFGLDVRKPTEKTINRLRAVAPKAMPRNIPTDDSGVTETPPAEARRWRHQQDAVAAFLKTPAGILEMATGTGKTRTALKILSELTQAKSVSGAIVTTDGNDLLGQWANEVDAWALSSKSKFVTYRHFGAFHELGNFVLDPQNAILVVSRAQLHVALKRLPKPMRKSMIIIHDEVHGLGQPSMQRDLAGEHASFGYRLGLSATPERAYDADGNAFIASELGPTIFKFPLEEAIKRGVLCEFDYIPLDYDLTDNDKERLSKVFARQAARAHGGTPMSNEELWIELSRIYKTAEMKPDVFSRYLQRDASILENAIIFVETREYGERILEIVHPHTHLYRTYYADDEQNHLVLFSQGEIDCLVTCHKISQGIDIRLLRSVVLFSAARSKLETIQRIGRCLRVDPENPDKRARVVDFVRKNEDDDFPNADEERRDWLTLLSRSRREDDDHAA